MLSDSGSSDGEPLLKKLETKKAETALPSKEKMVEPAAETSNPKKRQAEDSKDKQAKKPREQRESEASIPRSDPPVPPTADSAHLELHQDVSFISSFFFISIPLFASILLTVCSSFLPHSLLLLPCSRQPGAT